MSGGQELCVFSERVKTFCDSSGARSADGRLFQVVGPLTGETSLPMCIRQLHTVVHKNALIYICYGFLYYNFCIILIVNKCCMRLW